MIFLFKDGPHGGLCQRTNAVCVVSHCGALSQRFAIELLQATPHGDGATVLCHEGVGGSAKMAAQVCVSQEPHDGLCQGGGVPPGTRRPVCSCCTTSGMAPMREAMMGLLNDAATNGMLLWLASR